jgi:signal transduction histidine kinase/DNA-binding response OmpR family regulator
LLKEITHSADVTNFSLEYRFLPPNGDSIYVYDEGFVLRDKNGKALRIIGAASNITERKKNENDLIQAKEVAEKLNGFKDQFLANMSHEIRTPLNGIIGFTKILLRSSITKKQKEQLTAIKASSDILLVVINDILDLAKIEAGKMVLEETELKIPHLINSIVSTFELRLQEKEQTLHTHYDKSIPDWVLGDPVRINQILLNLLENAIKFTNKGGTIKVQVNLLKEEDDTVIIAIKISDTGIGIPEDKIASIFETFTQINRDTSRKYGGSGLGLNIVKQLIDLMKGTISVKSQLHIGSTFTLTIPLIKTAVKEIKTEPVVSNDKILELLAKLQGLEKLKILIVDDMLINQLLTKTILEDIGFETEVAENGKIAIQLLEKNNYDIILMDLQMPEMDGWEATEHIRNKMKPPKSTIPIIALTADVTQRNADKCKAAGMNEYVSKPINETDLLHKVTRLVIEKRNAGNNKQQALLKICNLDPLKSYVRNKPELIAKMLKVILKETPVVVKQINKYLAASDWSSLHANIHKIKPTLDLMGLPKDITFAALQIEEYAKEESHVVLIPGLLLKLEKTLEQAYKELEEELKLM